MAASPSPPREPVDLVLHMGSGKTGTSSIQRFLHENRARLAELGHLYPLTPGRTRHVKLGLFIKPDDVLAKTPAWRRQGFASPDDFRAGFHSRLLAEFGESGLSHVVMSDEALYGASDEALARLRTLTDEIASSLRLVVYLRRQDDHMVSRYQQDVQLFQTRKLTTWLRELNHPWIYDYDAKLRTWQRILEPTEIVVRRFERERFVGGSLLQDFLEAAGIDVSADELEQVPSVNDSLDAESVEFLRLLNLLRRANDDAAALLDDKRPLVRRLAKASSGPTLTAPDSDLDDFMEQWEPSNQALAREMLGDPAGRLFEASRKTAGTTSEQRLDPGRLDHFVALGDLPVRLHAPLRELAEREADEGAGRPD